MAVRSARLPGAAVSDRVSTAAKKKAILDAIERDERPKRKLLSAIAASIPPYQDVCAFLR
jgi:hypothetical protein